MVDAGVTQYFEPCWKFTRGSVFNVEYWTSGAFSPLKIEIQIRWKYTRGHFSTALQIHFFLIIFDDHDMLNIDPVKYWPQTTEFWILIRWIIHRVTSQYFGGWVGGEWVGSFCIDWTVSRKKSKYIFYNYSKLFVIRYSPRKPVNIIYLPATDDFC
jgi:hypothetical protein